MGSEELGVENMETMEMTGRVGSKERNFELFRGGAYGNRMRTWRSLEELRASGYRRPVTMRYAGAAGGGRCVYNVNQKDLPDWIRIWARNGSEESRIFFNESTPDHLALMQGEIVADERVGYALIWSRVARPMREALRDGARNHLGPGALLIVKAAMDPASYEDFLALLERHPGAAIEFSVFRVNVGDLRGRNTVFWEVRNY